MFKLSKSYILINHVINIMEKLATPHVSHKQRNDGQDK